MQDITVRLDEELAEELDTESDEEGVSRSEYSCETLQGRHDADGLHGQVSDLRDRLDTREKRDVSNHDHRRLWAFCRLQEKLNLSVVIKFDSGNGSNRSKTVPARPDVVPDETVEAECA